MTILPSWNEGAAKKSIVEFVGRVTNEGGPDYVVPVERIAAFDNDGTLWSEKPMYFQLAFGLDRLKALAPQLRRCCDIDNRVPEKLHELLHRFF